MSLHWVVGVVLIVGLASIHESSRSAASQGIPHIQTVEGRYIVQFRADQVRDTESAITELKAEVAFDPYLVYGATKGFAATLTPRQVDDLKRHASVLLVEPVQAGRLLSSQTISNGARRVGAKLNGPARIDCSSATSFSAFDVAVLDTGVDIDHPDLTVPGGARFSDWTIPGCNNGTNAFDDDHGHGTGAAGIIGATDNTSGVVGVAPGARTWSVKVIRGDDTGSTDCVAAGVNWVTQKKLDYILGRPGGINFRAANMSFRFLGNSPALCNTVNQSVQQGVVYASAAGNDNLNAPAYSPANCAHVITVSAIADYNGIPGGGASPTCGNQGPDDTLASFSNFGSTVEIAAPGTCLATTAMGGGTMSNYGGTSGATPHVAGAAVLFIWNGYNGTSVGPTFVQAMTSQRWTIAQTSPCGFGGDTDGFAEPLLCLAPGCGTYTKVFSDVDCSGSVTNSDASKVTSWVLVQPISQTEDCPVGPMIKINGTLRRWGDVDCNGSVTSLDSQKILQYVGGGSPSQNPGCPPFGSSVTIDVTGSL